MKTLKSIGAVMVAVGLAACAHVDNDRKLEAAAACVKDNPDSAYALLSAVDTTHFTSMAQEARYGLLLTEALDRLLIDETDDRIIGRACEYYAHHGPKQDRLKAMYYLGVTHHNAGRLLEAQQEFRKAEEMAQAQSDNHHLGLIYWHMGQIYSETYDYEPAVRYMQESVRAYEDAGEQYAADYSRLSLAYSYMAEFRIPDSQAVLKDLIDRYDETDLLYAHAVRYMADSRMMAESLDYSGAWPLYEQLVSMEYAEFDMDDLGNMAILNEWRGDSQTAELYLNQMEQSIRGPIDSISYYMSRYNIYDMREEYQNANSSIVQAIKIDHRFTKSLVAHSVSSALGVIDYERIQKERAEKRTLFTALVLSFVIVLLLAIGTSIAIHNRNKRIKDDLAAIADFKKDIDELSINNQAIANVLNTIVNDKVAQMEKLSEAYFSWEDEKMKKREKQTGVVTRDEAIMAFRKQLSELRSNHDLIPALEKTLNVSCNRIMERLRATVSTGSLRLKEQDYELLTLFFSGFPTKVMAFLCNMTDASVRMRKTRYKKLFETIDSPEGKDFRALLG